MGKDKELMSDMTVTAYLESLMALVMAYSLSPSWRSISLKVPMQPQTELE